MKERLFDCIERAIAHHQKELITLRAQREALKRYSETDLLEIQALLSCYMQTVYSQ